MADPLTDYMRPGFPKETLDGTSYRRVIEYVGPTSALYGQINIDNVGEEWGDHPGVIESATAEAIGGTDHAILTVIVERKFKSEDYGGTGGGTTGTEAETNYEIDWVDVQRSLYEHPAFAPGGAFGLTSEDVEAVKAWERNPFPEYKKDYFYSTDNYETDLSSLSPVLSANAIMLAKGIQQGIEFWVDKAPVARKSVTYVNGPPPEGQAGQKEDPPGDFSNLPGGYEWIRSADRALRRGGQNKWSRDMEWLGAKKVLIDVDQIFWS